MVKECLKCGKRRKVATTLTLISEVAGRGGLTYRRTWKGYFCGACLPRLWEQGAFGGAIRRLAEQV